MIRIGSMRIAGFAAMTLGALLLAACGGDNAGNSTASASVPANSSATSSSSTTLATPSLSGDGSATITVGTPYSFQPTASATASSLAFSIANKPAWASFNVATGQLSGTPSAADVGTYANISITASAGGVTSTLAAFTVTVAAAQAATGTATLSWTPPTQNTDGTALADLAGYYIYYGSSTSALSNKVQISNPGLTAYTVTGLGTGTTYFAISAYSASGAESALSNIGSKTI